MWFLLLQENPLPAPRSWDELLVYILSGVLPLAFGWLAQRQRENRQRLKKVETAVRLINVEDEERELRFKEGRNGAHLDNP